MRDIKASSYRLLGTTDDNATCDQCGRVELKMTYVLEALDADGSSLGELYAGSSCGPRLIARTSGRAVKSAALRNSANAANRVRANVLEWANEKVAYYGTEVTEEMVVVFRTHNRQWSGGHLVPRPVEWCRQALTELLADANRIIATGGDVRGTSLEAKLVTI